MSDEEGDLAVDQKLNRKQLTFAREALDGHCRKCSNDWGVSSSEAPVSTQVVVFVVVGLAIIIGMPRAIYRAPRTDHHDDGSFLPF